MAVIDGSKEWKPKTDYGKENPRDQDGQNSYYRDGLALSKV